MRPMEDYWWRRTGWRLTVLVVLVALAWVLIVMRHLQLVAAPPKLISQQAQQQAARQHKPPAFRGMLLDRRGHPLAVSVPVDTLALDVRRFEDSPEVWEQLAAATNMDHRRARERFLSRGNRQLIFLKRHLDLAVADRLRALHLPGVQLVRESRRYYPAGEVLAPVIGLTNIDSRGQEGLEAVFDERLRPQKTSASGRAQPAQMATDLSNPERLRRRLRQRLAGAGAGGENLHLTLDMDIQYLAYRALKETVVASGAQAGSLVAVDVPSGDILAVVSYPSYNPNDRRHLQVQRNRAVMDRVEPGSIMKPFTVAAALQSGDWDAQSRIDTSPGYVLLADGTRFADTRNLGRLHLQDILIRSSQVGAAKLAMSLDTDRLPSLLRALGFGRMTGVGLPAEAEGHVPTGKRLREVQRATLGFGYGFSVTLLQLVQAYSVLGNQGMLQPLRLVRGLSGPEPKRVLSPEIANQVLAMLEQVVLQGSGRRAALRRYRVAGKTGTVHIVGKHGYEPDRYRSLFAGLVPVSDPRIAIAAIVEEPNPNFYFGGQVVAPLFAEVAQQLLLHLGIPPDRDERAEGATG